MKKLIPLLVVWVFYQGNSNQVAKALTQIGPESAAQAKVFACGEGVIFDKFCVFYPTPEEGGK